jgi:hypothetical protein
LKAGSEEQERNEGGQSIPRVNTTVKERIGRTLLEAQIGFNKYGELDREDAIGV